MKEAIDTYFRDVTPQEVIDNLTRWGCEIGDIEENDFRSVSCQVFKSDLNSFEAVTQPVAAFLFNCRPILSIW
ncbi:hypothetical protein BWI96_11900 [Siphonobacter sp. SORGH_AS_0500]|nr:hypothetical protein BWI96_11900 [Siphonobacter sp. SORGH_AS_0500]